MDPGGSADQFLIEQIREGSEPAWRQMIDRYSGRLLAWPSWFPRLHARLCAYRALAFLLSAGLAGASAMALCYLGMAGVAFALVPLLFALLVSSGVMGFGPGAARPDVPRPASREDVRRALVSIAVSIPHYAVVGLFAWIAL